MEIRAELDSIINDGIYLAVRQKPDGELPVATLSRQQLKVVIGSAVESAADLTISRVPNAVALDRRQREKERLAREGTFWGRNKRRLLAGTLLAIGVGTLIGELIHQRDATIIIANLLIALGYIVLTDRK